MSMRALVAGWFSFEEMGATAGDLLDKDLVCSWLEEAGIPCDVALADPFQDGIRWQKADPSRYTHVIFVCGPFGNGWPITEFLPRFGDCRLIGVSLSMLESLDEWNPFDLLLERDSSRTSRPELAFLSTKAHVPVVGVVLVHPQREYGERARHQDANEAIKRLIASREIAVVNIDTRLDQNSTGLRTPSEVESLIAHMDIVVSTRLHGMVLALKNGVPVIAVDPIAGGAKIKRQAETIGWPIVFTADMLSDDDLQAAIDYCLSEQACVQAKECSEWAFNTLQEVRQTFIEAFSPVT